MAHFSYALTSSNINRFSKLFHYQNQKKICNNTITKDLTTPQVRRYTTLWNVKCLKSNSWKQDDFCNNTLHMLINKQQGTTYLLSQLLSEVTVTSCRSSAGILHGCLRQDGAPSHTARNTPTYTVPAAWTWRSSSLTCGPKQPGLESSRLRCLRCPSTDVMVFQRRRFKTINQLKQAIVTEWDKLLERFIDGAIGLWRHRLEWVVPQQGEQIKHLT